MPSLSNSLSLTRRSPTGRNAQMNRSGTNGRSSGAFPPGIYAQSSKGSASAMLERVKPSHLAPHWISWESLALTVSKIPTDVNTYTVWKSFSACGTVDFIELFENARGDRVGRARIRFRSVTTSLGDCACCMYKANTLKTAAKGIFLDGRATCIGTRRWPACRHLSSR